MTEERHNERPDEHRVERRDERESQLSAMFDGELPAAECELLARRLTRDDALRAQWSRYSLIGAALRAERGVTLHDRVALRVQAAVTKETTYGENGGAETTRTSVAIASTAGGRSRWARLAYPVAGASIAAGVAAVSILWLRGVESPADGALQASAATPATTSIVLAPEPAGTTVALNEQPAPVDASASSGDYTTPAPGASNTLAPPARLANYVVAHSEYSGPLQRRMALLGIVGAENGESAAEAPVDAASGPVAAEAVDAR